MAKEESPAAQMGRQSLEELKYIQQIYQNQYSALGNSANMVLQELQELNAAQKTLENMDIVGKREVLTSIGAQYFMSSRVEDTSKVLVGIGADYFIEKEIDPAKQHIAAYIQKRTEAFNSLNKNRKELEKALIEISYKIEEGTIQQG